MTDQQTTAADNRIERAARTLAYFEGSDVFTGPDNDKRRAARNLYLTRTTALLARTGTVAPRKTKRHTERADTVLGLSFDRKVTAAQLAALSADEITALFGALNTIAAITQKPTGGTA